MHDLPITRRNFLLGKSPKNSVKTNLLPFIDESGYTPNTYFYRPTSRYIPRIVPAYWMLSLQGDIKKSTLFSYEEILALPATEQAYTLVSSAGTAHHPMISDALWTGVSMREFLQRVDLTSRARYAQLYAADGYTTFLEISDLEDALLAYAMNGESLTPEHGFPVRLIVPGRYDYKMPRWLQRIEFTKTPQPGFWETAGWPTNGQVRPTAYLLSPRHLETITGTISLTGVAYGGRKTVTDIEISIDDAPWMTVQVASSEPYRWSHWQIEWSPSMPGDYVVKVRVADPASHSTTNAASPQGIILRVTD